MNAQENVEEPAPPILVCVTPYVPHPGIDHAGGAFLHEYLVEAIRCGWQVRVLAPDTADNRSAVPLVVRGAETLLHPTPSGVLAGVRNVVVDGVPATTGTRWWRGLPAEARSWLTRADVVDLQWADSIWNAPVLRVRAPGAVVTGLAHDIRTESLRRALRSGRGRARLEAVLGLPRVAARERESMNACRRVGVFKSADRETLLSMGVTTTTAIVPIVLPRVSAIPAPAPTSRRALFAAAFHRPENTEAALWLLDDVWPRVRAMVPGASLRLAGSRPPRKLSDRAGDDVEVTGYLADLSAAYADVACIAVPLLRGAGVKFKTVEALRAGYPVVTTKVGAEGVEESADLGAVAVSDDPAGFAEALSGALLGVPQAAPPSDRPAAATTETGLEGHFRELRGLLADPPTRARS